MNTLDNLRVAIQHRRPIKFTYDKPGKTQGIRIGNPHAIYENITKTGVKSIKVDIAQTSGASDSQAPFPSFRMFDLDGLSIHEVDSLAVFQIHPDYNRDGDRYLNSIEKI